MLHHKEKSEEGAFLRQEDQFRSWVGKGGSSKFPVASGRYHLYVSLACPWAHRTVIVRKLKKLEIFSEIQKKNRPKMTKGGRCFRGGVGVSESISTDTPNQQLHQ